MKALTIEEHLNICLEAMFFKGRYKYTPVVEEDVMPSLTKVKVECLLHHTTTFSTFKDLKKGCVSCKECETEKRSIQRCDTYEQKINSITKSQFRIFTHTPFKMCTQKDIVYLICKKCGSFNQATFKALIGRRKKCGCSYKTIGRGNKLSTEDFIEKMIEKFGVLRFDFSKTKYIGYDAPIKISCSVHGLIDTRPCVALKSDTGCKECGKDRMHSAVRSVHIERCLRFNKTPLLYILHFYNEFESFYKIGITTEKTVKARYNDNRKTGRYSFSSLVVLKGTPAGIYDLEKFLHSKYKANQYLPDNPFPGSLKECFSNIDGILDHIPFDQVEVITDLLSQQEIAA